MKVSRPILFFSLLLAANFASAKISPEQAKTLPQPANHAVDFTKEIKLIFEKSCVNCHGHGRSKGNFRLDNQETFLKGGDSGSPIVSGKSDESLLIELVSGLDPENVMPVKGTKLTRDQIAVLRAWIDQGAKWDNSVWFGKVEAKNLKPRQPEIPVTKKFSNPVDAFLDVYFQKNKIKWPDSVSDRVFARRVWLDIIGLLPPTDELENFVSDKHRDKRAQLVAKLLNQNRDYAEHWLTFWNDMLRNDYKGTGYIDGGRKQITKWLFAALENNKPYDRFVAELVNPSPESEGFAKGIVWRGVVNASQTPQMQAAQNISQVFMGLNLKCASCHDSFVNDWQLRDAYALANIYADETLEIFECDKATGKKSSTKFLYPEFGEIDTSAAKTNRLQQLASCVVSPKNGRLSRTLVNRLWGKFFGHALVEPVDDMEQAAWNSDLLDWLAEDFVAHNYDVKHLIAQITTSRAYQLPSVNVGENERDYVFRGPSVRRLTAEEFRDALTALTGIGYSSPANSEIQLGENAEKKYTPQKFPKWIWNDKAAADKAKPGHVYFRKTIQLSALPTDGVALLIADNVFTLFVNGKKVGTGSEFKEAFRYDLKPFLKKGENVFTAEVINNSSDNSPPETAKPGNENPAGFLFYARLRHSENGGEKTNDFISDKSWRVTAEKIDGWQVAAVAGSGWTNAVELGEMPMLPWRVGKGYFTTKLAAGYPGQVRAALVGADPLMIALGRPNREQVVTTRPVTATTLQALEMTNGDTLSDILKRGAKNLAEQSKSNPSLVTKIYQQALGRKPTSSELKLAQEIVGKPVGVKGVEDFLWVMTMLPEFQLIY